MERSVSEIGDAVAERHVGQASAAPKRKIADAGDAVGNRDTGQAGFVVERTVSDAGYRQIIDRAWQHHCTTGTGVARDGDGGATDGIPEVTRLLGLGSRRRG